MRKNNTGNFKTFWFKYSDYELREIDKFTYITPKEDSKAQMYDPFNVSDSILVDILLIGRYVENDELKLAEEKIINFVKKYGLLGELTYLPLNTDIVKQSKVYLPVGNVVCNKETLTAGEYIRLFLKCEKKQKVTIKENSKGEILELSIENEANPLAFI